MLRALVRIVVLLCAVLLGTAGGPGAGPAAAEESRVVRTEHYELHAVASQEQIDEWALVVEAAWTEFERFFEAAPKLKGDERLLVRVLANRDAWAAALRADRAPVPDEAGGYYWPASKTAYLFPQPTRLYTRVLLVHECAHQFHFLARTGNSQPAPGWYVEGIAEFLSWHDWDGAAIRLGVVPLVSLKDFGKVALTELSSETYPWKDALAGKTETSRPVAWAITSYLAHGDAKAVKRFDALRERLDRGTAVAGALKKAHGRNAPEREDVVAWLRATQEPFVHVFNEWEGASRTSVRGTANVVSYCRLRAPGQMLRATAEIGPAPDQFKAGLLLHDGEGDDYATGLVTGAGVLTVAHRKAGKWQMLLDTKIEVPEDGVYRFVAQRQEDGVTFEVNGSVFGPWKFDSDALGLVLQNSTVVFRDVAWE